MHRPHFLEYDSLSVDDPSAPYAVLPAPYERSTSFGKGTARAPAAILEASGQLELFDEELLEPLGLRVQTLPEPDMSAPDDAQALERVRAAAADAIRGGGRFLLTLGGEHSITPALVESVVAEHGPVSVLHMDAHLDLRDSYEGNRLSHACAMRRVMDLDIPITHVGIRSLSEEEYEVAMRHESRIFWARSIERSSDDNWMDAVVSGLCPRVYITIDGDCLDPSLMPGTGTPEPGGLSWHQTTALMRKVCSERNVVSADLVEVIPLPGSAVSEYTAARLAAKLMMYHRRNRDL